MDELFSIISQLNSKSNTIGSDIKPEQYICLHDNCHAPKLCFIMGLIEGQFIQNSLCHHNYFLKHEYRGHTAAVEEVDISNDCCYLASYAKSDGVFVWRTITQGIIKKLSPKFKEVSILKFFKTRNVLAVCSSYTGGSNSTIEIFEIENPYGDSSICFVGHLRTISRIVFSQDEKFILSASLDKTLRIWDISKNDVIWQDEFDNELYGLTCTNQFNQSWLACCDSEGIAYFYINSTKCFIWQAFLRASYCIEFISNSTVIMISGNCSIRFWRVQDLLQNKFQFYKEISNANGWTVQVFPLDNPQVIITCDCKKFRTLEFWNFNTGKIMQKIEIKARLCANSFVITKNLQSIICGGNQCKIYWYSQQQFL